MLSVLATIGLTCLVNPVPSPYPVGKEAFRAGDASFVGAVNAQSSLLNGGTDLRAVVLFGTLLSPDSIQGTHLDLAFVPIRQLDAVRSEVNRMLRAGRTYASKAFHLNSRIELSELSASTGLKETTRILYSS